MQDEAVNQSRGYYKKNCSLNNHTVIWFPIFNILKGEVWGILKGTLAELLLGYGGGQDPESLPWRSTFKLKLEYLLVGENNSKPDEKNL